MHPPVRRVRFIGLMVAVVAAWLCARPAAPAESEPAPDEYTMREALVIGSVGKYGRRPIHTDAIEAQLVAGTWTAPAAGDVVTLPDGSTETWAEAALGEDGWLKHKALRGGYACWSIDSPQRRVMILDAAGHRMVYVNGTPRGGDVYGNGWTSVPVRLREGRNVFLFHCARGRLRAALHEPKAEAYFELREPTLPDLIVGEHGPVWAGVVVMNATREPLRGLAVTARAPGLPARESKITTIAPLTFRKAPVRIGGLTADREQDESCEITLELRHPDGRVLDTAPFDLRIRTPDAHQKRTFISDIDGSVQYYAITPAAAPGSGAPGKGDSDAEADQATKPALFLTLHGAGVQAAGQARVYEPREWGHVVAPTNRRPFGFDWEEWGRLDALEVLERNRRRLDIDDSRVYLTGHSMGGHGTWQIGVTRPDLFAAIGPSAGWVSFWSYVGGERFADDEAIEAMLRRATNPSDTLGLARNTLHYGIYILHGEKDDNVPAAQARIMLDQLAEFHGDYAYFEQPGAGHWWGNRCCDWPPMFEFFARRTRPADDEIDHVEFHTACPGVSAWSHWVGIEQQIEALEHSSADVRLDREARRFTAVTKNVRRLALKLDHLPAGEPVSAVIDGEEMADIPWPDGVPRIRFLRGDTGKDPCWRLAREALKPAEKGPHRYGPFKDAFRHRMIFIYGTQGTREENAWAYDKARYDAETFWYRGNGSVEVIADVAFLPEAAAGRSVIIYGNANTNAAWPRLLGDSPVQVERGVIVAGEHELHGHDLACLFIRPRPDSDIACVGVVSGTGPAGMRLTNRLPYFVSGVGYPDCIILGPEMLSGGTEGVRAAGYFGCDWSLENGSFAWRAE
ncbi:MAG: prolyl oligopeptidase family serine peptidase [Planctomycetota bacterium]|nr:prolyl oligopeptidase family serine peptidase [Planctomycetota bacterium]